MTFGEIYDLLSVLPGDYNDQPVYIYHEYDDDETTNSGIVRSFKAEVGPSGVALTLGYSWDLDEPEEDYQCPDCLGTGVCYCLGASEEE